MANQENLKNISIRYYDPEDFPTKDLLTYGPGINDTNFIGGIGDVAVWAQDFSPNFGINAITPILQGGGTANINDNPVFPDSVRFTAAVHEEGNNSINSDYLGEYTQELLVPSGSAWTEYTTCVDTGGDDCGDILTLDIPAQVYEDDNGLEITVTPAVEGNSEVVNQQSYLSICHKDLYISGWGGNIGSHQNWASHNSNILGHGGSDIKDNDVDYSLTNDDIELDDEAGFYTLKLLNGTKFGKGGAYPAEFKEGERVRIFGATEAYMNDLAAAQTNDGTASPNRLFRGDSYWWINDDDGYGFQGWVMNHQVSLDEDKLPEDIDGVGFESPFFYHLQYSYMDYDYDANSEATAVNLQQFNDYENLQPELDPLQPVTINQFDNNITNKIDSRIKYIIFQNTLGMMNDATDIPLPDGSNVINSGSAASFAADFDTYDYGIVPVAGNYNQTDFSATLHNKVQIYIVFRDEWVGTPILYGTNDPRNMVSIDFDGAATIVAEDNSILYQLPNM
jgi:hypothetical protein